MVTLKFNNLPSIDILKKCDSVTIELSGQEAVILEQSANFLNDLISIVKHVMPENTKHEHILGIIHAAVRNEVENMKQEEPK